MLKVARPWNFISCATLSTWRILTINLCANLVIRLATLWVIEHIRNSFPRVIPCQTDRWDRGIGIQILFGVWAEARIINNDIECQRVGHLWSFMPTEEIILGRFPLRDLWLGFIDYSMQWSQIPSMRLCARNPELHKENFCYNFCLIGKLSITIETELLLLRNYNSIKLKILPSSIMPVIFHLQTHFHHSISI